MTNLFITADRIGTPTGGGRVTKEESDALRSLGPCEVWEREELGSFVGDEPWRWDASAELMLHKKHIRSVELAQLYAGTFTGIVEVLKRRGARISYTCAAHDIATSRREHEKFGIPYAEYYPHLCQPDLWARYSAGYFAADVLIAPSTYSARVLREQEAKNRIEVVPHGVDLPETIAPLPKRFTVGYLGAYGPDKGVVYLLQAWKKLNYSDATLVLAGKDSKSEFVLRMVEQYGGGNIVLLGWVNNVSDFYNNLSLYVQPSVTEGFGCEVLEGMAHGRPVLCSRGAGAADVVPEPFRFAPANVGELVSAIRAFHKLDWQTIDPGWQEEAKKYTWDKIRQRYIAIWKELFSCQ